MTDTDDRRLTAPRESTIAWIANYVNHNYGPAKEYSVKVLPVTSGSVAGTTPEKLQEIISTRLSTATANDYLILSGNLLVCGLCVAEMIRRFGHVNILSWDGFTKDYTLTIADGFND